MKKIAVSFITVLFISTAFLSAQSLDEVLEGNFEVMGIEELIDAKTSQTSGKMIQMNMEIPFKQYSAHPKKLRIEATLQGLTLIQTYNGKEGWSLNPFMGMTEPQAMSADELKNTEIQADFEGMLYNWQDKGYTVSLEENDEVEGAECYVVKAVSEEGDVFTYYMDVDSYVVLKMNSKVKIQGQEVESDTYMSNYQEGDGFVYAGKIETRMGSQVTATIIIDEMVIGNELDDSMFEKPTK